MIQIIMLFKYNMFVCSGFPSYQSRHGRCVGGIDPENSMVEEMRQQIMLTQNEGQPMHKRVGIDIFNGCSIKQAALWQRFKARDDYLKPDEAGFRFRLNRATDQTRLSGFADVVSAAVNHISLRHDIDPALRIFEGEFGELLKPKTSLMIFSWGDLETSQLTREFIKKAHRRWWSIFGCSGTPELPLAEVLS